MSGAFRNWQGWPAMVAFVAMIVLPIAVRAVPVVVVGPAAIVAKLNAAIHKAMKHPDFIKKMDESGATLIPGTPADFAM